MENDNPQLAAGAPAPAISQQIKLPSFWPEDPTSWFLLAKGQFTLRNVADPFNALLPRPGGAVHRLCSPGEACSAR